MRIGFRDAAETEIAASVYFEGSPYGSGCGWRWLYSQGEGDGHALCMRWVLMLFVILAAVMGGEARAVVVMGRGW
jgi:hypothetical protein